MNTYTSHITPYDLAFLGTIFVGLTFTLQLWFTKRVNRAANRFLALALLTVVLWMAWILGIDIRLGTYFPRWSWLPLQFSLALGPLIFFYVLKITRPEYKLRWKDILHFSPLLLELGVLILEIRESIRTGAATYDTLIFQQFNPVLQLLTAISVITYLYWSHRLIEHFYQRLKFNNVGDRYRYDWRWLHNLLIGFGLLWLLWVPCTMADYFYYHYQLGIHAYYPLYLILAVMTICMAAVVFLRQEAGAPVAPAPFLKPPLPAEMKQRGIWLKKAVKAGLHYQDPELSLTSLAEKLELTTHELSRIINTALKKSFADFINEYRILEVARKMQDPAYDHITLLGIAYDSGFNSKTNFNRAFRQLTGKSPAEYKSLLKKERPFYNTEPYLRTRPLILHRETPVWSHEKLNRNVMFRNYLKIAWRNLIKNKAQSLINISGLSVGMAVAMFIGLWMWSELSYDSGFKNRDRIAVVYENAVVNNQKQTNGGSALPLAPALRSTYGSSFKHVVIASYDINHPLTYNGKTVTQTGNFMEPAITDMLSLNMLEGSAGSLNDPSSVLLSRTAAKAVFGDTDPLNKLVTIDKEMSAKVTGVYQDLPQNSSFGDLQFIAPWQMLANSQHYATRFNNPWGASWFQTFVQLADNADMDAVSAKIKDVKLNALTGMHNSDARFKSALFLYPMNRWYLYADFKDGVNTGGRIQYVWLFGIIGIFVLLLACINFMNLSTARSEKRAREVGIRKAIGSVRGQLIAQFYSESILIAVLAFALSLLLVALCLPAFNQLAGKQIAILWGSPLFWALGVAFSLFTGFIAGSYPALYLSAFSPVKVLKGTFRVGRWAAIPRKVLVVVQFSVSTVLIIGTIVVFRQIQYAKDRPAGYSRNNLVNITLQTGEINKQYQAFRNDLLASGCVTDMAESESEITQMFITNSGFNWTGKDPGLQEQFITMAVTSHFGKTLGWEITSGRDFNAAYSSDSSGFIVNESAVKFMGLKHPLNENVIWNGMTYKIIGVVKDMVNQSAYDIPQPTLFYLPRFSFNQLNNISIKISPSANIHQAISKIAGIFKKYDPATPFAYHFVDQDYAVKFDNEEHIGKLASCFAGLAIFISCLGLFGMASFMAEQRVKEIGVRKALGASVFNLWRLLSKDFVVLVIISLLVAAPFAYFFMHSWLQSYAYRTGIAWWVFAVTALAAVLITMAAVSFQSIKAALANPVKSLKSE